MNEQDLGGAIASALLGVFAAQGVGTVAYLAQLWRLFGRLAAHHAPAYEPLGRPHLLFNNSLRSNTVVLSWLWSRGYEAFANDDTISIARRTRTLLVSCAAGFLVMMFLFVLLQVVHARVQ